MSIITHPIFVMTYFLTLMMVGENGTSIYSLYLIKGLAHFDIHAVMGLIGSGMIIMNYIKNLNNKTHTSEVLYVIGTSCLHTSLFDFFVMHPIAYDSCDLIELIASSLMMAGFIICSVLFVTKQIRKT